MTVAFDHEGNLEDRLSAMRRAWSAVSEQPLTITPIEYDRAKATGLATRIVAEAKQSDVIIYPIALGTELVAAEAITSFSDEFSAAVDRDRGSMLPALRNGLAIYADQIIGLPLGTPLPAIVSTDRVESVESWQDYDQLVADRWHGKAGEPSAPGWAAAMFLWRAADIKGWLFDREEFRPLIDTDPYVQTLERFIATHDRYETKRQRPADVWSGIISGSLLGGISWQHENEADVEVNAANLPESVTPGKVLFGPFASVTSLSADCRQSATAKRFISWISGDKSSESMRRQLFGASVNRAPSTSETHPDSFAYKVTNYDRWLTGRLSNPITRPTLQLQKSTAYYAALDQQVGRALDHEASAKEALDKVAKEWRTITQDVGVQKQLRNWKRVQGLRG